MTELLRAGGKTWEATVLVTDEDYHVFLTGQRRGKGTEPETRTCRDCSEIVRGTRRYCDKHRDEHLRLSRKKSEYKAYQKRKAKERRTQ